MHDSMSSYGGHKFKSFFFFFNLSLNLVICILLMMLKCSPVRYTIPTLEQPMPENEKVQRNTF